MIWVLARADANQPTVFQTFVTTFPYGDKIGHFCLFSALSLLLNVVLKFKRFSLLSVSLYAGSAGVLSFAIIEEFSQLLFAPQRTFDLIDLIADICGVTAAHFVTQYLATRQDSN